MIYTCDALLPDVDRYVSDKYKRVHNIHSIYSLNDWPALARELAVFMNTPGFRDIHFLHFFQWKPYQLRIAKVLQQHPPLYDQAAIDRNTQSVTPEDAQRMLVLLEGKTKVCTYWSHAYVRDRMKRETVKNIAKSLDMKPLRVGVIGSIRYYDPLTFKFKPVPRTKSDTGEFTWLV